MSSLLLKFLGLAPTLNTLRSYALLRLQLLSYILAVQTRRIITIVSALLLLSLFWGLALLLGSLAIANYLNMLLGSLYLGYLLMAAGHFTLGLVAILCLRSHICQYCIKQLIVKYLANKKSDI